MDSSLSAHCEYCSTEFEWAPNKRFCSRTCKSAARKNRRKQELIDAGLLEKYTPRQPTVYTDPTTLYRNYEKTKIKSREKYMKDTFGLTLEEANKLKDDCKVCPICGTDKPQGRDKRFVIDHCKDTKKIRGVICNNCNQGIGFLRHDPEILKKAADYMIKFLSEGKK